MKFRDRIQRFLQGRNGSDELSRFLSWVGFAFLLASLFTPTVGNGLLSTILWAVALAAIVWSMLRTFSRNIYKRQKENAAYRRIMGGFTGWWKRLFSRVKDGGRYKYFKCRSCGATLRVPCKKGKVQVTCPKCRISFIGKT